MLIIRMKSKIFAGIGEEIWHHQDEMPCENSETKKKKRDLNGVVGRNGGTNAGPESH